MTKLIIKNLTKQFYALKAVDNVSLALENSQIYGLIGPNGSGKTTLFNCISGIYCPEHGQIVFCGETIHGKPQEYIAMQGMRRTFQTIRLCKEMSVAENIYSGYYINSKQNILQALFHGQRYHKDELEAWDNVYSWAAKFQLTSVIHAKAGGLAYGLQRKVEIARAMISDPHLLVLDEPAAGMNEREKLELSAMIRSFQHPNLTILMIEHDMHMIATLCQKVFVLNQGRLIASGTPSEIQSNPEVVRAYMGLDYV